MKKRVLLFASTYVLFTACFMLGKPLFMLRYHALFADVGAGSWWRVVLHGLPLDLSLAGYFTLIPTLLLIATCWTGRSWPRKAGRVYFAVAGALMAAVCVVDLGLYEYWGFRLDATPLFYFFSSPKDALAGASWALIVGGLAGMALLCLALYLLFSRTVLRRPLASLRAERGNGAAWRTTAALGVLGGLLFIPIRGGVTVSTMNVGQVYFSENMRLNHAAINPLFSLMESLSKQKDFGKQYRFMDAARADALFRTLQDPQALAAAQGVTRRTAPAENRTATDTAGILRVERPNVVIVILESFSAKLMGSLGGRRDVAVNLDRIAADGLLFTHFYANSFRTDRGLVSILSGFPAQPTTSLMKYPHKTQSLPSICQSLRRVDYDATYYYGGDADFTNMRSYLTSSGYGRLVSDHDFPVGERLSKWGVHDHLVLQRALADIRAYRSAAPTLRVVQTSSSHEPFEVPYSRLSNPRLNAFAYTDSCVGRFVDALRRDAAWDKTLVVLVADHQGAWPEHMDNLSPERYEIPLILTGGALRRKGRVGTYGSQADIAATLLGAMHLPHGDFRFSKDLFNPESPHFAFFTCPDALGMVTAENCVVYDKEAGRTVVDSGRAKGRNLPLAQAYLQKIYDDIAAR